MNKSWPKLQKNEWLVNLRLSALSLDGNVSVIIDELNIVLSITENMRC